MEFQMASDDDSCPKCGHGSGDGSAHTVCPGECSVCGWVGISDSPNGCPYCHAWEIFKELSAGERLCMKEMLDG